MQINQILRFSFLLVVFVITFFSIILVVNNMSSLNKYKNDLKNNIYKQQVQRVSYRSEIERKIDDELKVDAESKKLEIVKSSELGRINDAIIKEDKTKESNTTTVTTQKVLVGY